MQKSTHNAFHRRLQTLGRLLANKNSCLDKIVKKQLEKLDCFIGYSHLLPGCFGLSVSHGHVDTLHTHTEQVYVAGEVILILCLCLMMGVRLPVCACMFVCDFIKLSPSTGHWS